MQKKHWCALIVVFGFIVGFILVPVLVDLTIGKSLIKAMPAVFVIYSFVLAFIFTYISLAKNWLWLGLFSLVGISFYSSYVRLLPNFNYKLIWMVLFFAIYILLPYFYALFCKTKNRLIEPVLMLLSGLEFVSFSNATFGAVKSGEIDESFYCLRWLFYGAPYVGVLQYFWLFLSLVYLIQAVVLFIVNKKNKYLLLTLALGAILFLAMGILLPYVLDPAVSKDWHHSRK